jgi:hypothetical protein
VNGWACYVHVRHMRYTERRKLLDSRSAGRRIILKFPDRSRIGERGLDLRGLGQAQVSGNELVDSVIKQAVR